MGPLSSALLVPFFSGLLLVEWVVAKKKGIRVYSWADTSTNIACALGQFTLDIPILFMIGAAYTALSGLAPLKWDFTLGTSLGLFVLTDFLSYWFHRASHKWTFLWRVHAVHHQSQEFNFSVGIRIPWFHKLVAFPIYLPPALLGFDFKQYLAVAVVHATLQTFSHTRIYDADWPIFRDVFVTPVHHRVHHSRLAIHHNRNFSNVLSIWDRLFGTGLRDLTEPVYGLGDGPASFNPLVIQIDPFATSADRERSTSWPSRRTKISSAVLLLTAVAVYAAANTHKSDLGTIWIGLGVLLSLGLAIVSGALLEPSRVSQRSVENHSLHQ
ncbi:MAG: sterol desaturase family protein [Bdellovibrionota bacterium]